MHLATAPILIVQAPRSTGLIRAGLKIRNPYPFVQQSTPSLTLMMMYWSTACCSKFPTPVATCVGWRQNDVDDDEDDDDDDDDERDANKDGDEDGEEYG